MRRSSGKIKQIASLSSNVEVFFKFNHYIIYRGTDSDRNEFCPERDFSLFQRRNLAQFKKLGSDWQDYHVEHETRNPDRYEKRSSPYSRRGAYRDASIVPPSQRTNDCALKAFHACGERGRRTSRWSAACCSLKLCCSRRNLQPLERI